MAGTVQPGDSAKQVEAPAVRTGEAKGTGVHTHQGMAAGARDMPDAGGGRIAAVSDQAVAALHRELPERLAGPRTLGLRQPEMVADQGRQAPRSTGNCRNDSPVPGPSVSVSRKWSQTREGRRTL